MSSNNPFSPPAPRLPPHLVVNSNGHSTPKYDSSRSLAPPSPTPYHNNSSQEHLLLPASRRPDASPGRSPFDDGDTSSRRSSWQSERTGNRNPFDDDSSRPVSRDGSEEDLNTQTVSEKYNITPSAGLLLFPEDVEKDDYLHNPDPGGEPRDCDIFSKRGIVNVGGLAFIVLGLLCLFIGYPILYVPIFTSLTNPLLMTAVLSCKAT